MLRSNDDVMRDDPARARSIGSSSPAASAIPTANRFFPFAYSQRKLRFHYIFFFFFSNFMLTLSECSEMLENHVHWRENTRIVNPV